MAPTPEAPSPIKSGGCRAGCTRLSAYLRAAYKLGDSGCYNPNSRAGGGPSYHVSGCAIDLTANWNDPIQRARGLACFNWAIKHADEIQLQEMIFGRNIISARRWREGVRTYTRGDHHDHIHLAVSRHVATNWKATGTPTPVPTPPKPKEEDEMYRVIKGDVYADLWLTNWLEKRHIGSRPGADAEALAEAKAIITAGVTNGAGIITWPQTYVNNIPTAP